MADMPIVQKIEELMPSCDDMTVKVSDEEIHKFSESSRYLLVGIVLIIVQLLLSGYSVISVLFVKNIHLDVFILVLFRSIIAAVTGLILAYIIERKVFQNFRFNRQEILYFSVFGLVATSLNPIMYLYVVKFTSASYVTILGQLIPIFNTIFCWILKLETMPTIKQTKSVFQVVGIIVGCSFAVAIAGVVFTGQSSSVIPLNWLYGTLIGVLNNLAFSFYHVLQAKLFFRNEKSRLQKLPFTVNAYCAVFGSLLYTFGILPYLIIFRSEFLNIPKIAALPILYSSCINSTLCFGLMAWCVFKASPPIIGSSFSFQVASSILLLNIIAGEQMLSSQYWCCAGVVIGVLLVVLAPTLGTMTDKYIRK